jgi:hypothetical protein
VIHVYILAWKLLFLLPAPSERVCAPAMLRYGPPDGKWERGTNPPPSKCEFRVSVMPGDLLPVWVDPAPVTGDLEVTYGGKTVTVRPVKVEPVMVQGKELSAKASKVRSRVRIEVKNASSHPVLLGDSVAVRSRPQDDCVGPGPAAVLQPGESLVDVRPGLLSPSMQVWVAVFTAEKQCKWVEVSRH